MKPYAALTIAALALSASAAQPQTNAVLRLSWETPTRNMDGSKLTDLAGYRVYQIPDALPATVLDVGLTNGASITVPVGVHHFAVTAYNRDNVESPLSAVASRAVQQPQAPVGLVVEAVPGVKVTVTVETN